MLRVQMGMTGRRVVCEALYRHQVNSDLKSLQSQTQGRCLRQAAAS